VAAGRRVALAAAAAARAGDAAVVAAPARRAGGGAGRAAARPRCRRSSSRGSSSAWSGTGRRWWRSGRPRWAPRWARGWQAVVAHGRAAATAAAQQAARPRGDLFRQLGLLREQSGVDALAVYTDAGDLVAWAGEHRGPLPDSVWLRGDGMPYFEERPLFSYLYFSVPVAGRAEHAVAAVLVETGIIGEGRDGATADIVAARTRTRATFRRGAGPDAVWALAEGR
jgi:hypothetical protein